MGIGLYFFLALAIARMHAEFGPPAHDLHYIGPEIVMTGMFGSAAFTNANLTGLSWFWWFNRAYRSIPIAYQLDGLKIAQRSGTAQRYMAARDRRGVGGGGLERVLDLPALRLRARGLGEDGGPRAVFRIRGVRAQSRQAGSPPRRSPMSRARWRSAGGWRSPTSCIR